MHQWIRVKDELPAPGVWVLVTHHCDMCIEMDTAYRIEMSFFEDGKWFYDEANKGKITHWMSLPDRPERESG